MRAFALIAALATAGQPPPTGELRVGVYCPLGADVPAIVVDPGVIGIDGLDCQSASVGGGRLLARACYTNGGSTVPYDTDLAIRPDGMLEHDGARFRWREREPCPDVSN